MNIRRALFYLLLIFSLTTANIAHAVLPSEMLDDPVLEERAREISKNLRCLVCQNQDIDESDAPLAADLRILVRERLLAGDSNAEVLDYIVARYGEYVLLNPRIGPHTIFLWISMPLFFLIGAIFLFFFAKKQKKLRSSNKIELTAEERAILERLKKDSE